MWPNRLIMTYQDSGFSSRTCLFCVDFKETVWSFKIRMNYNSDPKVYQDMQECRFDLVGVCVQGHRRGLQGCGLIRQPAPIYYPALW